MLFYVSVAGLLFALLNGAWVWAFLLYLLSGVMWIAAMQIQRHLNRPMGLTTLGGALYVFLAWPLSAFYWYYARWKFRGSRFRVCPHDDSETESSSTVLGEFGSWEEAVSFAKGLAFERKLQLDVLDQCAVMGEPWIYYVLPGGRIYRLDEPNSMSEYQGSSGWKQI